MSRLDDDLRRAASHHAREPMPPDLFDPAIDAGRATMPPRWPVLAFAAALVVIVVAGVRIGTGFDVDGSPNPSIAASDSVSPSPGGPIRYDAALDDVHLTVEVEHDRVHEGEPIFLTATVENRGTRPAYWSRTGCQWSTHVGVQPSPPFDPGRQWDGEAAQLKRNLMFVWNDSAPYNFGPADQEPRSSTGCFMEGGSRQELPPGGSLTDDLVWLPEGPFGMPLGPRTFEVTASFPIIPPTGDDPYDRDASDNVTVTFEVAVEGSDSGIIEPGPAIDLLLEDERLWALLDGVDPERWIVPRLSFSPDSWLIVIPVGKESARLEPDFTITAEVDARTSELVRLGSGANSGEARPTEPVSDTAEVPGSVTFTLSLDRDRTAPGQPVWAELVVDNIGTEEVVWATIGGCPLWPTAAGDAPPDLANYGRRDWTGDAATLKSVTVDEAIDIAHDFLPQEHIGIPRVGCDLVNVPQTLAGGESRVYRSVWYAENAAGAPVASGVYHVEAELRVDRGPLRVRVPLTVNGQDLDWLAPGEAIDRLLEDPEMQELLAQFPRNRWNSQDLIFEDERWKLSVYVSRTPTDWAHAGALLGTVDALDGHVYGIRFDPMARPPGCEVPSTACDP